MANEVEAYTFQNVVGYNATDNQDANKYQPTIMMDMFGLAISALGENGYSVSECFNGVDNFKNSGYNNTGKYDSYKSYFPLSWKPLLKLYNIKYR